MYKALHTVSPIRQSLWGSGCLSACVSPFCHHHCNYWKKKSVCVLIHAQQCLWALVCTHQSVFLCVKTLLPTDGNLRHNAGGLSFEAPFPPPIHPPPPLLSILSSLPLPTPPPSFPPCPSAFTKQKESFNLTQAGPTTWLEAVEGFLCYYEETNLAVHLTQ